MVFERRVGADDPGVRGRRFHRARRRRTGRPAAKTSRSTGLRRAGRRGGRLGDGGRGRFNRLRDEFDQVAAFVEHVHPGQPVAALQLQPHGAGLAAPGRAKGREQAAGLDGLWQAADGARGLGPASVRVQDAPVGGGQRQGFPDGLDQADHLDPLRRSGSATAERQDGEEGDAGQPAQHQHAAQRSRPGAKGRIGPEGERQQQESPGRDRGTDRGGACGGRPSSAAAPCSGSPHARQRAQANHPEIIV